MKMYSYHIKAVRELVSLCFDNSMKNTEWITHGLFIFIQLVTSSLWELWSYFLIPKIKRRRGFFPLWIQAEQSWTRQDPQVIRMRIITLSLFIHLFLEGVHFFYYTYKNWDRTKLSHIHFLYIYVYRVFVSSTTHLCLSCEISNSSTVN